MHISDDLCKCIIATKNILTQCMTSIESFEQERQSLCARVRDYEKIARQCERAFYGNAMPLRIEIEGLEGRIRCLDEQIQEQKSVVKDVTTERSMRLDRYLIKNDPCYKCLVDESQRLKRDLTDAKEICEDFLGVIDSGIDRVLSSQHHGMIHGIVLIAVADPREVECGIGIVNTAIDYFNRNFDYRFVLSKGVSIARVHVPYGGPSLAYLQEAKRQILLRKGVVTRFRDTIATKILTVPDAVARYINDLIDRTDVPTSPYR